MWLNNSDEIRHWKGPLLLQFLRLKLSLGQWAINGSPRVYEWDLVTQGWTMHYRSFYWKLRGEANLFSYSYKTSTNKAIIAMRSSLQWYKLFVISFPWRFQMEESLSGSASDNSKSSSCSWLHLRKRPLPWLKEAALCCTPQRGL